MHFSNFSGSTSAKTIVVRSAITGGYAMAALGVLK